MKLLSTHCGELDEVKKDRELHQWICFLGLLVSEKPYHTGYTDMVCLRRESSYVT